MKVIYNLRGIIYNLNMKKRILLKDIAEKLNLTTNTVSRALQDREDISEKTKQRVRETADLLGYIPDQVASSMRTTTTQTVAVLFDNLANPYFMIVANMINGELLQRGYQMMIFTVSSEAILTMDIFKKMISRRVDGVISFLRPEASVAKQANQMHLPMCVIGREADDLNIDSIFTNDYQGGYLMGQYLNDKKYKHVGYLGGPADIKCNVKRAEGLFAYYQEHALKADVLYALWDEQSIINNTKTFIESGVEAIFCFNDSIAYETILYIKKHYPNKQIEVTGYDNIANQLKLPINIATIGSDTKKMVSICVEQLMQRMNDFNTPLFMLIMEPYLIKNID